LLRHWLRNQRLLRKRPPLSRGRDRRSAPTTPSAPQRPPAPVAMEGKPPKESDPLRVLKALQTGNTALDLLLALLIPFFIQLLLTRMPHVEDFAGRLWVRLVDAYKGEHYERWVNYSRVTDDWNDDESGRELLNGVLQKAILLYIDEHCGAQLDKSKFLKTDLLAKRELKDRPYWDSESSEEDTDDEDALDASAQAAKSSGLTELDKYTLARGPVEAEDVEIEKELFLLVRRYEESAGLYAKKEVTDFRLSCRGHGATQRVDGFVKKAYSW
ncbi:hypothetical protein T492DRAFT_483476, partial [Pavlovales sp. CCMP2436]